MKILESYEITFEDLTIEQYIYVQNKELIKETHVIKNKGEYLEELAPSDPDYTKMIIKLHNHKHQL
jgi:hypothetical protein